MKSELLIIKSRNDYIKIIDSAYHLCGLDKASVFPFAQLDIVTDHVKKMKALGFDGTHIKKLIIMEEDFDAGDSYRA
jgi:hypothetical protein